MRRDTKAKKITRHVILGFLAITSMVLSWMIWTNPARYEKARQNSAEKVQVSQVNRQMDDVVLPTQIFYTNDSNKTNLINDNKVNFAKEIVDTMRTSQFGKLTHVSQDNKDRFLSYANSGNTLVMKYPANVTGQVVNDVFKQQLKTNMVVNELVFNFKQPNKILLLNDKSYDVYQIVLKQTPTKKLQKIIDSAKNEYEVKFDFWNHRLVGEPDKSVKMNYYSFLVNKESSNMVFNLLGDSDTGSIDTKKIKDGTQYLASDNTKRLSIQNNGLVTFQDFGKSTNNNGDLKTDIEKSFSQLRQLGLPIDNMRYFDYSQSNQQIEFRNFVGGYPIFNDENLAEVKVARQENQMHTIFSLYNLDVPVPDEKVRTDLPNFDDLTKQLESKGVDLKKVDDLQLGYQWKNNQADGKTVELTPTWYIRYHGKWQVYDQVNS